MSKKIVAVFGGSGFLGSHVADCLSNAGFQVRIYDCRKSPYLRPDQEMIIGDILDLEAVTRATQGCYAVYNFAGIADLTAAKDLPIETVKNNVLGNVHVLEAARVAKVERFVMASTVYVYSDSGSFYRASKQACERYVEAYAERYGISYTILRYGSLFGRRADERNTIYNFLHQALWNKEITYDGSPDAVREYIHVEDAARLSVDILDQQYANRHLILTGRERMTVRDVLKTIAEIVPGTIKVKYADTPKDEGHYIMTPYSFNPRIGHKLLTNDHVDIGQGLLDCLTEITERAQKDHPVLGDVSRLSC